MVTYKLEIPQALNQYDNGDIDPIYQVIFKEMMSFYVNKQDII